MTDGQRLGTWFGLVGVAGFSLTLPATRVAVLFFDPVLVTFGRALLAAGLAALALSFSRQPLPARAEWPRLAVVAGGVVLGFPLLSSWAMRYLPASHGAVVLGLLPLATAGAAVLRNGERPSLGFWLSSVLGSSVVIAYGLRAGGGSLHLTDLGLLGAVIAAALGYAEGGRLARTLGGWQTISWALLLAAPFLLVPFVILLARNGLSGSTEAWLAFGYLGTVSQFAAFVAWYKGLALGGVAWTGQLQLLQPFLTVIASTLFLGEHLALESLIAATLVLAAVALSRRTSVTHQVPAEGGRS